MSRQITAITTQLEGKMRDFYDNVAKELQELQDCGRLNEVLFIYSFFVGGIFALQEWRTITIKD